MSIVWIKKPGLSASGIPSPLWPVAQELAIKEMARSTSFEMPTLDQDAPLGTGACDHSNTL